MSTPSILSAIRKFTSLLTRTEKIKWIWILGFAVTTSLFEVLTASVIVVFAQVLSQPESGQKYLAAIGASPELAPGRVVFYIAILMGVVYFIKNLIAAAEAFYQNFAIQKMNYEFKNKLLHRYVKADYEFCLTRNSSLSMEVVAGDTESMFSSGMTSIAGAVSEGIVFLCLMGMIVAMNPSLALAILGIGSVLGVSVTKGLLPHCYRFGQKLQEAAEGSQQNLTQFFHAFKEIVLLNKREAFINAYQHYSCKKSRVQAIQATMATLPRVVIEVLFVSIFVTTIAFLCWEHQAPVKMIGILGGYLYVGFRLMPGLNRIVNQLNTFKSIIPSIERVHTEYTSFLAKEHYIDIPELKFEQYLALSNINFRYLNTKKDALSNISIKINKGECIGIVGKTGSGKSTLVDVILGLLKPYQGSILIDNRYTVNSYQWHQHIGYVPQTIYLTDDTIEANIAFGEQEIDTVRLNTVIDAAQLRTFINQLPQALKTIVGERGIRLSGGERQRIAIARALYRNPEVLIFDEATSALDTETETKLMETIHTLSQNHTVIMVAHRLATLKNCDKIVVMEKGTIQKITRYKDLKKAITVNHV